MKLAYYDETGDDGFPKFSSAFFVLTALYLDYRFWQDAFSQLLGFRRFLKNEYGFPIRMEFHTRAFLRNRRPYCELKNGGLSESKRVEVIDHYCRFLRDQAIRSINVCIVKKRIHSSEYNVLHHALTYSIQRVENDLKPSLNPEAKFIIITDEGRQGMMRRTARILQRFNYVPSMFGSTARRMDIVSLVEDPLPKNSRESYFIQSADLISFIVYLYSCYSQDCENEISTRIRAIVSREQVLSWMSALKPILNLEAARDDQFGVFFHPKK